MAQKKPANVLAQLKAAEPQPWPRGGPPPWAQATPGRQVTNVLDPEKMSRRDRRRWESRLEIETGEGDVQDGIDLIVYLQDPATGEIIEVPATIINPPDSEAIVVLYDPINAWVTVPEFVGHHANGGWSFA